MYTHMYITTLTHHSIYVYLQRGTTPPTAAHCTPNKKHHTGTRTGTGPNLEQERVHALKEEIIL